MRLLLHVARLQRAVTALHLLVVLPRTPTRDRAIKHRCQQIRECLGQIEAEADAPPEGAKVRMEAKHTSRLPALPGAAEGTFAPAGPAASRPPAKPEEYYDFSQSEKTGAPE